MTLHFHPDRLYCGRPLLERLAADRVYRSQFETSTSNGGLTAHPGGRPLALGVPDVRRDLRRLTGQSATQVRLAQHTLERTTFRHPDSVFEPTAVGTARRMALMPIADADHPDQLDYIEAQVHGPVLVDHDVEALVLDPAYHDTTIENAASALPFPIERHQGFRFHLDELAQHSRYRGDQVVEAGRSVAVQKWLEANIIGAAAHAGTHDEQTLKRLLHCTARFGRPLEVSQ